MLFLVNSKNKEEKPWSFQLEMPAASGEYFRFAAVREEESFKSLLQEEIEFSDSETISGLADYTKPCTIIQPFHIHGAGNSFGISHVKSRSRISGKFQGFLDGIAVDDINQPIFKQASFSSKHLHSWLGINTEKIESNFSQQTFKIEGCVKPVLSISVHGVGKVEITTFTIISSYSIYTPAILESNSNIKVIFENPISLKAATAICFQLDILFSFLIGHQGELSEYDLFSTEEYDLEGKKVSV